MRRDFSQVGFSQRFLLQVNWRVTRYIHQLICGVLTKFDDGVIALDIQSTSEEPEKARDIASQLVEKFNISRWHTRYVFLSLTYVLYNYKSDECAPRACIHQFTCTEAVYKPVGYKYIL
jgi:hypothetical protein